MNSIDPKIWRKSNAMSKQRKNTAFVNAMRQKKEITLFFSHSTFSSNNIEKKIRKLANFEIVSSYDAFAKIQAARQLFLKKFLSHFWEFSAGSKSINPGNIGSLLDKMHYIILKCARRVEIELTGQSHFVPGNATGYISCRA